MPTELLTATARIIEVFSSIQGEGLYVGQPHLFVRFWDCNLACHYCDTDYRGPYATMTLAALEGRVSRLLVEQGPHDAVALTGGEPLLWWQFLTGFLPRLKAMGVRTYLETNGTLPKALAEVLPWVDVIAMDIKPPSATADRACWSEHAAFLEVARRAARPVELFVKVVVTAQTTEQDLDQVAALMAQSDRGTPCVLQPVTPLPALWPAAAAGGGRWPAGRHGATALWPAGRGPVSSNGSRWPADAAGGGVKPLTGAALPPTPEQLRRWLQRVRSRLEEVRVIPQVHPGLGVP